MQSPININTPKSNEALTGNNFYLDYKFEKEVPFVVTRHGPEVVVKFQGYGGALKVIYKKMEQWYRINQNILVLDSQLSTL